MDALGYQFLAADDRLIMPWPNHRVSLYFGQESGLHLTMLARMRMTLDLSTINEVAQALTSWNTERIGPTALLRVGDLGDVEIQFRSSLSVDEGVSTDQLMQFIQLTINTVEMAVDTVLELFSDLNIEGAGSEELCTEQDESDLLEEISGLFVPPSLSANGFDSGRERRGMDVPRHPSFGNDDDSDNGFSDEFFRDAEDSGKYDDIWDASADQPDGPTPAGGMGDTTDDSLEDQTEDPTEEDSESTIVRESREEPFLPIFSQFTGNAEGADKNDKDDEDVELNHANSGDHDAPPGDDDLLDLLALLEDGAKDPSTDIPVIADHSLDTPGSDSFSESFHIRDGDSERPEYPREVTLDRVRDHLADIGVVKTSGEEDFLVAWINEVFIGFFIDNGPTFLVKGHWDPDMDPDRDFMKLFMMCNQWNERSLTTKAFCHKNSQGLQVRVEFAVPTAEGLTDDQLRHNIALSIHHLLQAVDSLSIEATGSSIVDWPEST